MYLVFDVHVFQYIYLIQFIHIPTEYIILKKTILLI
jgi:hypothetical protein